MINQFILIIGVVVVGAIFVFLVALPDAGGWT